VVHPKRKQRLIVIAVIVSGVALATAFILMALEENMNAFYTPSDILEGKSNIQEHRMIRVGGLVVDGSVARNPGELAVRFLVTDQVASMPIHFDGILPDLFREGQGIIAIGHLKSSPEGLRYLQAKEVLAKHDENYMSPELKAAMEAKGQHVIQY
jgi:cytochrome c-type biogenesis protein CcmE